MVLAQCGMFYHMMTFVVFGGISCHSSKYVGYDKPSGCVGKSMAVLGNVYACQLLNWEADLKGEKYFMEGANNYFTSVER